jgi:hypothetical protein
MPRNRVSIHLLNKMVERIGCSIGDIKVMKSLDVIRVPITCEERDVKRIEKCLYIYNMMNGDNEN